MEMVGTIEGYGQDIGYKFSLPGKVIPTSPMVCGNIIRPDQSQDVFKVAVKPVDVWN
jgi:hypothetical protein